MFFAPWLQALHRARRLPSSSVPPWDLSTICPTCNRAGRPVRSSESPAAIPHMRQVKPLRSKTRARVAALTLRANLTGGFSGGNATSRYSPGLRSAESLFDMICHPSSSRSSRRRRPYWPCPPLASLICSVVTIFPTRASKKARMPALPFSSSGILPAHPPWRCPDQQ